MKMNPKVAPIKVRLEIAFPGSLIEYVESGGLHKLRINHAGPTHWLILDITTVNDNDEKALLKLFESHHVVELFKNAAASKRICLTAAGLVEQPIST